MQARQPVARECPKRHPDAAFRPIGDDGGLVVMPDRGNVIVLNPVGIKIFSLLDGRHPADEIVAAVIDEFEVSEDDARQHLAAFLDELTREGLLIADAEPGDAEGAGA